MVKKLSISLLIFTLSLNAGLVDEKVKNLVEKDSYLVHQKLIDIIFKDKKKFYKPSKDIDIVKISKYLKKSGLLNLFFEKPQKLTITFNTNQNPLFFMKLITDSLNSMGYFYFITKEAKRETDIFSWSITLVTEYAIDPVIFAKELKKRDCEIIDILRNSKYNWEYLIDISKASVAIAQSIELNRDTQLEKSIEDYWLKIQKGESLKIVSEPLNSWYPYIAFYDSKLNLIGLYKNRDSIIKSLNVRVPDSCRYIKISDSFTLNNIKNGFRVYLKGE